MVWAVTETVAFRLEVPQKAPLVVQLFADAALEAAKVADEPL